MIVVTAEAFADFVKAEKFLKSAVQVEVPLEVA